MYRYQVVKEGRDRSLKMTSDSTAAEIEACPHCGGKPGLWGGGERIHCTDCGAVGPQIPEDQILELAIKIWNTKATK